MSQAQNISDDKAKPVSVEELAAKPVDEAVQAIADAVPAPEAPAAEPAPGKTAEEIANEAAAKSQAEYDARMEEMIAGFKAKHEALLEEGLQHVEDSKRKLNPPTPLDELAEPMDMADATAIKTAQIVWLRALKKGTEDVGIKAVSDKLGKHSKDVLPLTLGNIALSAEMSKVVLEAYPEYTKQAWALAELESGQDLMVKAGYDEKTISKMPKDVLDHWAMSQVHDHHFETEGPGILDRLKSHKATITEALGNDNVQRSLKWAGLIVGCATGGIVAKAGVTGISFLASKLAENPTVQGLAKTLEDKSVKFVSKTFNIDEAKVRAKVDKAKDVAETVSNSKWATAGKVVALVGLGVALGNIDFVKDAAHVVAENSAALLHSSVAAVTEVAHTTATVAAETAHNVGVAASDHLRSVAEAVDPRVVDGFGAGKDALALADTGATTSSGAAGVSFDEPPAVAGTEPAAATAPAAPPVTTVEVKHGDSLWKIAERHLEANGGQASNSEIQKLENHVYETNKEIIGDNPNLIFDHQKLVIDMPSPAAGAEHVAKVATGVEHAASKVVPAVNMIETQALPSATDEKSMKLYMDAVTQRARIMDDTPSMG